MMLLLASPARAELAFSGSIATDDRFRGDSTSGERPVATLAAAYDDIHGPYAGASVTLVASRHDGLQPLRSIQFLGYASRLKSGLSLDIGVTNRIYSHYFTGEYGRHFAEAYVGVIGRKVSSHIFYSPDYDGHGGDSLYGEVDGLVFDRGNWSVSAHAGALLPPREEDARSRSLELDGRLGVTRRFGRTALSLNFVGATSAQDRGHSRGTALLSLSHSF